LHGETLVATMHGGQSPPLPISTSPRPPSLHALAQRREHHQLEIDALRLQQGGQSGRRVGGVVKADPSSLAHSLADPPRKDGRRGKRWRRAAQGLASQHGLFLPPSPFGYRAHGATKSIASAKP